MGYQSASTVFIAITARTVAGVDTASTVASAENARSAVGHHYATRSSAPTVQGVRWVINLRARSSALSMQGVRVEQMTSVD